MVNLAKKAIIFFPERTVRLLFALVCLIGYAWSAVPAQAIGSSLSGLSIGPQLTADLSYGGSTLAAKPVFYGPQRPPTVQQVLLSVCQDRGYGEDCARTLLGMAWKESRLDGQAVGDSHRARGFFQIHYKLHHISLDCAQDLRCSAEWTLSYLESNGYPRYPLYATQCHNGCNVHNGYAAAAISYGRRLWNTYGTPAGAALLAVK